LQKFNSLWDFRDILSGTNFFRITEKSLNIFFIIGKKFYFNLKKQVNASFSVNVEIPRACI